MMPTDEPKSDELGELYAIASRIITDRMECESVYGVYEPMSDDQVSNLRDEIVTAIRQRQSAHTVEVLKGVRMELYTILGQSSYFYPVMSIIDAAIKDEKTHE